MVLPRHLITPLLLEFNIIVSSLLGMLHFRCMFWFMATLVCGHYGLWPFGFVAVLTCNQNSKKLVKDMRYYLESPVKMDSLYFHEF